MSILIYIFAAILTAVFSKMTETKNILTDNNIITYSKKNKIQYWIMIILSCLPFFLVSSLRYNVGTDYKTYLIYQVPLILQNKLTSTFELLFKWIVLFSVNILGNVQFIFVIFSFIFLIFLFMAIYKLSEDISLSMLLILLTVTFNWSLNIMRQSISAAIFIFSLQYIKDRKIVKYMLCIGLAFCFHKTSIILFPMYFILNINFKEEYKAVLALFIFALASKPVLQTITKIIVRYGTFYINYIGSKYEGMSGGILLAVNIILTTLMTIIVDKKYYKKGSWYNIFYNIQLITTAFAWISPLIPNGSRMIMMFVPVQIISIPYVINHLKYEYIQYKSKLKIGVLLLYIVFFVWMIVYKNYGETIPYHLIF